MFKQLVIILIAFWLGSETNFSLTKAQVKNSPTEAESNSTEAVKVLVTHPEGPYLMEINDVPPPFDVAGNFPYVLWINGKHIPSPPYKDLSGVVAKVGESNIPSIDPADIHKGWLEPHYAKTKEEENLGRTRSLSDKKKDSQ